MDKPRVVVWPHNRTGPVPLENVSTLRLMRRRLRLCITGDDAAVREAARRIGVKIGPDPYESQWAKHDESGDV